MSSSGRALEAGAEISETYRILEKLGEGGMGAVYLAEMIRLPKRVALKVLHFAADESAKARFRREAEIAAAIRHPRIVEVLDYNFLDDGSPYLVMELLEGYDLRHRLDFGPCEPAEALPILRDIGSALECLHREGIVHRDLKPENIFLAKEGDETRAKVLDFGISKMVGAGTSLTAEQTMLGTPAYMAPEQVTGQNASLDAKVDQFALAAVAYEMLTGRPAFLGENVMQLFHQILHEPAPPLDAETSSPADAVFSKALSKDRATRYPSVRAFIVALSEALSIPIERFSAVDVDGDTVVCASPSSAELAAQAANAGAGTAEVGAEDAGTSRRWLSWVIAGMFVLAAAAFGMRLMGDERAARVSSPAGHEGHGEMESGLGAQGQEDSIENALGVGAAATNEVGSRDGEASAKGELEPPAQRELGSAAGAEEGRDGNSTGGREEPDDVPPEATPRRADATATGSARSGGDMTASRPQNPDALRRLESAEASLEAGDARAAIRHARASVGLEPSSAARKLLVIGYCELRDLGNAKAMARGIRGRELRKARTRCESLGVNL